MSFPWDMVKSFTVESCADGTMKVKPEYLRPHDPDMGGGPGLGERLALAYWIQTRLLKRGMRAKDKQAELDRLNAGELLP